MDAERWRQVKAIFDVAKDASVDQQGRILDEKCAGDDALRAEVQSLLQSLDTVTGSATFFGIEDTPERIGPYSIIRPIGKGGMGVVYLARQTEPIFRQVAVKLIKVGMDTREVVARFEAERQALALMAHPNIAHVLDAGASEEGRPYFAMEYVPGDPIHEFCDRSRLDLHERLTLFVPVCDAIQHAHQKGVIHRDIKPSNVLVMRREQELVPKVIDFGVAKATNLQLTKSTLHTHSGLMIGTPEYASPEQAANTEAQVDTRTDVYSLGVLLYELLSGQLPFGRSSDPGSSPDEILRRVRLEEPLRPSTRIGSPGGLADAVARCRRSDVPTLVRTLRHDLDWIVLKALEKDPGRRYATASALAADIGRYLAHEPIEARPPTAAYRVGKFVRRHRAGAAAAVAILAALLAGLAGTTAAWRQALVARRDESIARTEAQKGKLLAERESRISRSVLEFLTDDLLGAADPDRALGTEVTVREVLDLAESRVQKRFADEPAVEAQIRLTLGRTYASLRALSPAAANLERALELRRATYGPESLETAEALDAFALATYRGNPQRAIALVEESLRVRREKLGEKHFLTLRALGDLAMYRAVASGAAAAGMDPQMMRVLVTVRGKGETVEQLRKHLEEVILLVERLWASGRKEEARRRINDEIESFVNTPGLAERTPWVLAGYGMLLANRGAEHAAEALYDVALDLGVRINGPNHQYTLYTRGLQAQLFEKQSRSEEAEHIYRELVRATKETRGDANVDTLTAVHSLGRLLLRHKRWKEAEELYRDSLDAIRAAQDERSLQAARVFYGHGIALWHLGRSEESTKDLVRAASLYVAEAGAGEEAERDEAVRDIANDLDAQGHGMEAIAVRAKLVRTESH